MTDHAIVIGIDAYSNPAWELKSAVRDAIHFADWVTADGAGRASYNTLGLLLSPRPSVDPGREFIPATRGNIHAAFDAYARKDAGADAERLWVYYAGHASHQPGGNHGTYPVLIPSDVEGSLDDYLADEPLGMAKYLPRMQHKPPVEQLFFIDACRGIAEEVDDVTRIQSLVFSPKSVGNTTPSNQAPFMATTAGREAFEQGLYGNFTRELLRALDGLGPRLQYRPDGWHLTLAELADYVTRRLSGHRVSGSRADTSAIQVPRPTWVGFTGNESLLKFNPPPTVKLKLLPQPRAAGEEAEAWLVDTVLSTGNRQRVERREPPLSDGVDWDVLCGLRTVRVEAPGYRPKEQIFDVDDNLTEAMQLDGLSTGGAGLESLGSGTILEPFKVDGVHVRARDNATLIELVNESGHAVEAAFGSLIRPGIAPGAYLIRATLPTQVWWAQPVAVEDRNEIINLSPDFDSMSTAIDGALLGTQIPVNYDGWVNPSERFGGIFAPGIGEVLSWASWAARFPGDGDGRRLRSLGVDPLPQDDPNKAYVQVLAGDLQPGTWLGNVTVGLDPSPDGPPVNSFPIAALEGRARQWATAVHARGSTVLIDGLGSGPLALPVPPVSGYVHVLIVAKEVGGRIDIHRYLHPLVPASRGVTELTETVRFEFANWKALADRRPLTGGEAEELMALDDLDPLALCVLGFRLLTEASQSRTHLPAMLEEIVRRVKNDAPDLSDGQVLAAILATRSGATPTSSQPMSSALPVIADAYEAVLSAETHWAATNNQLPPVPDRPLSPGYVWTVLQTESTPVGLPPALRAAKLNSARSGWRQRIAAAVAATAAIRIGDAVVGSGTLVGRRLVLVPSFVAEVFENTGQGPGNGVLMADFGATSVGIAAKAGEDDGFVILRLDADPNTVPLAIVNPDVVKATELGAAMAVVGHPFPDVRVDANHTFRVFGSEPDGEKWIVTGTLESVSDAKLDYAAFTVGGMAGGPVVDLETGNLLAVHRGGDYRGGVKYGFGNPIPTSIINMVARLAVEANDPEVTSAESDTDN